MLTEVGTAVRVARQRPPGETFATLHCRGLWATLGWVYYANDNGRHVFDEAGNGEQVLGWGLTDTTIGFDSRSNRIHDGEARLRSLPAGAKVDVSGSASNDGGYTVESAASLQATMAHTSTTISFDPFDDIFDSDEKLDTFTAPEMVEVTGSTDNNKYWFTKTVAPDTMTVRPGDVTLEAAGDAVTITQGNSVVVDGSLATERPGSSITLTAHGEKVAQSFQVSSSWTLAEAALRIRRIGEPSDNVKVELCSDSSGSPGTVLDSATVSGGDLTTVLDWHLWDMSNTEVLAAATTYWLVVSRTGSNDPENCYSLAVDEELGYGSGALKVYDGASWVSRSPGADMPFQLWGHQETTQQIADIISSNGQFLKAISIVEASGIETRQYRDGGRTAREELEDLVKTGATGGKRLSATVTHDYHVIVDVEPDEDDPKYVLVGGKLQTIQGVPIRPGAGVVGHYVRLPHDIAGSVPALSPVYVEAAEYDADAEKLRVGVRHVGSAWDIESG